jgi:eukaryotic-like serine/threonine-protein kinase
VRAPDRWTRVRTVLEQVVSLPPHQRQAFMLEACKGDPDVQREVESILRARDTAGDGFLEPASPPSLEGEPLAETRAPLLEPGTRLGTFEILAPLGAGGMGQVYRARDTRLGRSVAIKILSPALAARSADRERFEREAQAISRLTHPHICVLYDVGRVPLAGGGDRQFLVMELVDGETLAARLKRGPMPLDQTLRGATQIAGALAAAHSQGIVHRDLKPANIMLTKAGVKLLDFGLARLREPPLQGDASSASRPLTHVGMIAGTLSYMSPEQLRGEEIDARSDIFAFGSVLYEMLSGHRAFAADSHAALIAMILEHEPPWLGSSRPDFPPSLDRLVRVCLAKDPAARWQHAHDVALELEGIEEQQAEARAPRPARAGRLVAASGWAIAAILGVTVALLALSAGRRNERAGGVVPHRLMLDAAPVLAGQAWSPIVSPDGRMVVFLAKPLGGWGRLFARRLDTGETRPLTEISDDCCGFSYGWLPDGRTLLGFEGQLKAVDVATGVKRVLAESSAQPQSLHSGVSVSHMGTILVGGPRLQRLMADYQAFRDLYDPHPSVTLQLWPSFLPNGRDFLFTQAANEPSHQGVFLGSLDSDRIVRLLPVFSNAVASQPGYVVFGREGSILAQPVDIERRSVTGEATIIGSNAAHVDGYTHFALGSGHTLVYVPNDKPAGSEINVFDRAGRVGTVGSALTYRQLVAAPDGRRVAVERIDSPTESSLWILDIARGTLVGANVTMADMAAFGGDGEPTWAPDGNSLAFTAWVDNDADLYVTELKPGDRPVRLAHLPGMQWAKQWSADGKLILFTQSDAAKNSLWALPVGGDRTPFVLVDSPALNDEPQLSPDGRWLAYISNESGQYEVYLQPFGRAGQRWKLSTNGGGQPKWRADGRELFYLTLDGAMMSVAVRPDREPGEPRTLFRAPLLPTPSLHEYAVMPDGRFLILSPARTGPTARLIVVSNWPALLAQ